MNDSFITSPTCKGFSQPIAFLREDRNEWKFGDGFPSFDPGSADKFAKRFGAIRMNQSECEGR